jgi:diacylglycerol kinase (ATP)
LEPLVAALAASLRHAGHESHIIHTRLEPLESWLDPALDAADLLVVLGGDGAVRMAAPAAVRAGKPIYHLPQGTENLFAREFGMDRSPETLLRAIERRTVRKADIGVANGRTFLLMASIGFDAEVVHDLAGKRGRSISHWSYVPPILRQLRNWRPPRLEIEVDGERLPIDQPGFVVIANSAQYGWRLNPCAQATIDDGLLDVGFFPTRTRFGMALWAMRCRMGRQGTHSKLVQKSGKAVRIRSDQALRYQLDGDPPGEDKTPGPSEGGRFRLDIEIQPGCLSVLVP